MIFKGERAFRIDWNIDLLLIFENEGFFTLRLGSFLLFLILDQGTVNDRALFLGETRDIGTPSLFVEVEISLFEILTDRIIVIDSFVGEPAVDRCILLGKIEDTDRVVQLLCQVICKGKSN